MGSRRVWHTLGALGLGQLISLCMTGAAFASSALAKNGVDAPLAQSFVAYIFIVLIYGSLLLYRRQKLQVPWYWYALLGLVDMEGNYFIVKAYQYTSITSVTLLDCWTIAWVMIVTRFVLKMKYKIWQYIGAITCIIGLALVFLSDSTSSDSGGQKPLFGDFLVMLATIFYALSNVGEEFCVKKKDLVEVVAMIGIFGSIISAIQLSIFERKEIECFNWSWNNIILFLLFGASLLAFYTFTPFLLQISGATLFNLSLLTSDMWAIFIRLFFFHESINWLYFLSFGIVAVGLCIYSYHEKEEAPPAVLNEGEETSDPYMPLNDGTENDTA